MKHWSCKGAAERLPTGCDTVVCAHVVREEEQRCRDEEEAQLREAAAIKAEAERLAAEAAEQATARLEAADREWDLKQEPNKKGATLYGDMNDFLMTQLEAKKEAAKNAKVDERDRLLREVEATKRMFEQKIAEKREETRLKRKAEQQKQQADDVARQLMVVEMAKKKTQMAEARRQAMWEQQRCRMLAEQAQKNKEVHLKPP